MKLIGRCIGGKKRCTWSIIPIFILLILLLSHLAIARICYNCEDENDQSKDTRQSQEPAAQKSVEIEVIGEKTVVYFYSPGCEACLRVNPLLERLTKNYPYIELIKKNITLKENQELREAFNISYKVPEKKRGTVPSVFFGRAFIGEKEIKKGLEKEIRNFLTRNGGTDRDFTQATEEDAIAAISGRFKSFKIPTIVFAGLVDGVNPCAIAVLLFFISYLVFIGKEGKEVWIAGILFCSAIFITYLLIGLGFLRFLYASEGIEIASKLIYPRAGSLALVLGIYSFFDYLKARKGKIKEIRLQLPKRVKSILHLIIARQLRRRYLFLICFLTGFLVALIEFLCTGQIYLPTLIYMMGISEYRNISFTYLVLYNIMFVLPLIGIFILVGLGMGWQRIRAIFLARLSTVKFLTSCLFFFLSVYMFIRSAQNFGYL